MRILSRGLLVLSISLPAAAWAEGDVAGAQGETERLAQGMCRRIRAQINLTNGTIAGNFGLNGSALFTRDGQGTAPPTAPAGSSVFSGLLAITTARGTLSLRETGMFSSRTNNPDGAVIASWGDSPSGTGVFEGVTGDVFFAGQVVDGVLLVQMTGELCRP
jgi:hypothetical protein